MRCYRVSFFTFDTFLPSASLFLSLNISRRFFPWHLGVFSFATESFFLPLDQHLGVFLSSHRIFLSATKLTSRRISFPTFDICRCHWIGAYTSICASENPGIRLFANSHFFEHLRIKDRIGFFAKGCAFPAASVERIKINTCLIGLTGLQTVPGYLLILADEDQAVTNQLK